jgi:hypothetical protein
MKLKKISVWLFLLAGVLYVIAGLRDIFAPGFFKVSPAVPGKSEIAFQFLLAGTFLALAGLTHLGNKKTPATRE